MSFWLSELAKLKDELLGPKRPRRKGMAETMGEQRAAAIRERDASAPAAARPAGRAAPRPQAAPKSRVAAKPGGGIGWRRMGQPFPHPPRCLAADSLREAGPSCQACILSRGRAA